MIVPALQAALDGEPFDYRAYLNQSAVEELRLSMWCTEHRDIVLFCDHKHQEQPRLSPTKVKSG
jgi:hypothetical protein